MRLSRKQFLGVVSRSAAGSAVASTIGAPHLLTGAAASAADAAPKKLQGAAITGSTNAVKRFIATTTLNSIPPDAIQQAKRCVIDGLGVILAGSTVRGSAIVREYVKSVTDKKEATVLGPERLMAPVSLAAMANGASGHAMD